MSALEFLDRAGPAILVQVTEAAGSTPRDQGAWMLVSAAASHGTIGGGVVEHQAMAAARAMLNGATTSSQTFHLGPDIGQCCGGRMTVSYNLATRTRLDALAPPTPQVLIFGAGHVGAALFDTLSNLPLAAQLIDERPDFSGLTLPAPEIAVREARPGAGFVVATHAHASDFLVTAEALKRGDAAYVGMIGSNSKRAQFERWLAKEEPDVSAENLTCPIGASGLGDKRPEVIALHVATELVGALS